MSIKKEELFSQDNNISKSINNNPLFISNKPRNNNQSKNDSLTNNKNSFLRPVIQDNQSNSTTAPSLFGNSSKLESLFGNGSKNLFG